MAYFTVKRDIAPVSLGLERHERKHPRFEFSRAFFETQVRMLGWATNVTLAPHTYTLIVKVFELTTGNEIFSRTETRFLAANVSTELFDTALPKSKSDDALIISSCLKNAPNGVVVARCMNLAQPYRYLEMPRPRLDIRVNGDRIFAVADVPVKGLAFYAEDVDGVVFEDNLIDLVPGDEQAIVAGGLDGRAVSWKHYGVV